MTKAETLDKKQSAYCIMRTYEMLRPTKAFANMSDAELVRYLVYCGSKGWLRFEFEKDELCLAGCAYRVKEYTPELAHKVPEKEEGDILFCAFLVSVSGDRLLPKKTLTKYLDEHPEISEIIFYTLDRPDNPYRFKRKGDTIAK